MYNKKKKKNELEVIKIKVEIKFLIENVSVLDDVVLITKNNKLFKM